MIFEIPRQNNSNPGRVWLILAGALLQPRHGARDVAEEVGRGGN
jgi:hypothetical protein